MKYCSECGYHLDKGTEKFCPECGEKLGQKMMAGTGGDDKKDISIGIHDTKGGVSGVGFSGDRNIIDTELGGYTLQGNVIHLHVNSLSTEVLERIIRTPAQVDVTSTYKGINGDNKDIKKRQEFITTNRQTSQVLEELNEIEKKEGTQIQEIKAGDLQISKNELLLKEIILKGNEHYYKNEYPEAIRWYDNATEINPNNFDAWYNKGYAFGELGKYGEAVECYNRAIELDPNNANLWFNKGNVLDELGKYGEAVECYNRAIELDPNYPEVWNNKGVYFVRLGKYEEAIECYNRAIELDQNDAEAWYNKGYSLGELGKDEEAIKFYNRALELDPNYTLAWFNKGIILQKLGRYIDAEICYNKAKETNEK